MQEVRTQKRDDSSPSDDHFFVNNSCTTTYSFGSSLLENPGQFLVVQLLWKWAILCCTGLVLDYHLGVSKLSSALI